MRTILLDSYFITPEKRTKIMTKFIGLMKNYVEECTCNSCMKSDERKKVLLNDLSIILKEAEKGRAYF